MATGWNLDDFDLYLNAFVLFFGSFLLSEVVDLVEYGVWALAHVFKRQFLMEIALLQAFFLAHFGSLEPVGPMIKVPLNW